MLSLMLDKLFLLHRAFQFHHYQKEMYEMAVVLTYFFLINPLRNTIPTYVHSETHVLVLHLKS